MNVEGEYARVAVVAQLPDGRIVTHWGHASVVVESERPPFQWGDTIPKLEHATVVQWTSGFCMVEGMPGWAEDAGGPLELPYSQAAITGVELTDE